MSKEVIGRKEVIVYLSFVSIVIYITGSIYFFKHINKDKDNNNNKHINKDEDNNRKYIIYTIYGIITGIGLLLIVAALYD